VPETRGEPDFWRVWKKALICKSAAKWVLLPVLIAIEHYGTQEYFITKQEFIERYRQNTKLVKVVKI